MSLCLLSHSKKTLRRTGKEEFVPPCKIVNYPPLADEAELEGKFVQFQWRGITYLLFAIKAEHRFHNQMLGRFFEEHAIPHHWQGKEALIVDSDEVSVSGGGRFRYTRGSNRLELWDNSQVYGRFDDTVLEQCIHAATHPWATVEVMIS